MKKMKFYQKLIVLALLFSFIAFGAACQKQSAENTSTDAAPTASPTAAAPAVATVPGMMTPTESYKKLFAAVKNKNNADIKLILSKQTQGFAEAVSGQQKSSVDEVLKNGFTGTTFAEKLPEMRDERIKGNMGALEVYNEKEKKWEDLPFVLEDGGWRLAIGDIFSGSYTSPGKGRAQIEFEASNKTMELQVPNLNGSVTNSNPANKPAAPPTKSNK